MERHPLSLKLIELRTSSRWPDQDDFSTEIGMSLSGYKKYESGSRIPTPAVMQRICSKLKLTGEDARALWNLRDDAKAKQVGISRSVVAKRGIDLEALAKRIENETSFILKQAGVDVPKRVGPVLRKRVSMILNSAFGA